MDELTQEHEEHEKEHQEHKNTHKIQEPFPLPVGPTGPIESTRRWRDRQVDTRRDLGWLFIQRSTEPIQQSHPRMKDWQVVKLQVEVLNPRRDLLHKERNHPHKGRKETFEKKESSSTLISKPSLSRSEMGNSYL